MAVASALALVGVVAGSHPSPAGAVSGPLTWAPPVGWESYTPYTIPEGGGTITFPSNTKDYRIVAPKVITGPVVLRGGRNIVWIGGHIRIDRDDAENGTYLLATKRRAILIDDGKATHDGRTVFLEGLRLDGDDLSEGVDMKAPKAHIYLQNIGIDTVRHRGYDDRDSTGPYAGNGSIRNHADLVQLYGGAKSINIDGLSGRSNYQGMFLADTATYARFPLRLRRVDMQAVELPDQHDSRYQHSGHVALGWYGNTNGQIFVDNGTVWFQHHENSGWAGNTSFKKVAYRTGSGSVVEEPVLGASQFAHNFRAGKAYPTAATTGPYAPVTGSDATGTYVTWPASATLSNGEPAFRNWSGDAPGRIYSGLPQDGSYVPLPSVGLAYQSPGYATGPLDLEPQPDPDPEPGPDVQPPTVPDDFDADRETRAVRLEWDESTDDYGVTGYDVQYRRRGTSPWAQIALGPVTEHEVTGLTSRVEYEFQVRARDAAGNVSDWSAIERATPR